MADLDELKIRINADSSNAQRSIDKLVRKLDSLNTALSGIDMSSWNNLSQGIVQLGTAMNSLSGAAKDPKAFTSLAHNLNKLARLDGSKLASVSTSMITLTTSLQRLGTLNIPDTALQVVELSKAFSKLGGANATRAVTNIPQIATAMKQMMATLSTAPLVNRNVIDLANSMANLASQGGRVRAATSLLGPSMNNVGRTALRIRPHFQGLASAIGKFYASCFLAIRGVKALWAAIGKSMDYIEVKNYFDAAMEQLVLNADLSKWEELGYESAQAYAESFGNTLTSMVTTMSGYAENSFGMLAQTGGKSLGLNATDLIGASTNFAQIASSMGVATDNAVKLSKVLTELGADIASVKNQDFSSVWNNLQSGMVGMARAVDKYGVNIRNANLQTTLQNIGIDTAVANLGQEEKALLRVIVMLDSTKFAYGDLADTIQQPANQVRMLKASFENFSRSLGNIFLPIVAKIIPYLITLTNALVRLNEFIVSLLGFTGFNWGGSSGVSDLVSDALDAEEAFDGATGSANKLKKALQGFDELNNLTTNTSGGSGGGMSPEDLAKLQAAFDEAIENYQKQWDEAFDNMADTYNSFADDIAKAFNEGGMFGVGKYFSDLIADSLNGIPWDDIKAKTSEFSAGFAHFLNGLISPEGSSAIGKTIAESLNTIVGSLYSFGSELDWDNLGESASAGAKSFLSTFDFKKLGETLKIWIHGLAKAISKIVRDNDFWALAFEGIGDFFSSLGIESVGLVIGAVSIIQGASLLTSAIQNALGRVGVQVSLVITAAIVGLEVGNLLGQFIGWLANDQDTIDLYVNFHWMGEGGFFDEIFGNYNSFSDYFYEMGEASENAVYGAMQGNPEDIFNSLFFFNGFATFYKAWEDGGKEDCQKLIDNIKAFFSGSFEDIDIDFNTPFFSMWIDVETKWMNDLKQLGDNIEAFFKGDFQNIDLDYDTAFFNFFSDLTKKWGDAIWGDDGFWMKVMHWWGDTVKPFFNDAGKSIWNIWADGLNNLIGLVENFANMILDGFNNLMTKIGASFSIDLPDAWNSAGIPDLTFGSTSVSHLRLNRIQKLAEGGIATSSTIANIGEAGKEAVLPLERNTGWMDSLAEKLVVSMNQQGGGSYTFVAQLDGNTLFEETVRQNDMWKNSTGHTAFA